MVNIIIAAVLASVNIAAAQTGGAAEPRELECRIYGSNYDMDKTDMQAITAEVISPTELRNIAIGSPAWRTQPVILGRASADSDYRPTKPSRKDMNRFKLGTITYPDKDYPGHERYSYWIIYLPAGIGSTEKFNGEREIKEPDGGASRKMYCRIR